MAAKQIMSILGAKAFMVDVGERGFSLPLARSLDIHKALKISTSYIHNHDNALKCTHFIILVSDVVRGVLIKF